VNRAASMATWVLRLIVGGVFLAAGLLKLRDPTAFALEVTNYRLAEGLAPYVAVALPPVEVAVGVSVLALPEEWRRAGAVCAALILLAFTALVAATVLRGINVSCGCFGTGTGPVTWLTVVRDAVLFASAAALVALLTQRGTRQGEGCYATRMRRRSSPRNTRS
jgi:putative oxidoreductase